MPSKGIRLEIARQIVIFKESEVGLRELLAGPVVADLARRAIRVESSAKRHATGSHAPGETGGGPNVITGRLRGSITWRLGEDTVGPYADIGTSVFYAPFVEFGTSRAPAYPFLRPALEAARDGGAETF